MAAPSTDILSAAQRRELLAVFRQDRKSSIWPWIGAFAFLTVPPLIPHALHATVSETGKNRGLKRWAKLILLYYVPHEPLVPLDTSMGTEAEAIQSSPRFFLVS